MYKRIGSLKISLESLLCEVHYPRCSSVNMGVNLDSLLLPAARLTKNVTRTPTINVVFSGSLAKDPRMDVSCPPRYLGTMLSRHSQIISVLQEDILFTLGKRWKPTKGAFSILLMSCPNRQIRERIRAVRALCVESTARRFKMS
jgi:hypothetical protein